MLRVLITIPALAITLFASSTVGLNNEGDHATVMTLPNVIYTGSEGALSDSSNHHYGMSTYDGSLYMTLYRSGQVTKVSLEDHLLVGGFPSAGTSFGNHGIEIDESDGSIWTGTANSVIKHHSAALGFLTSKTFPFDVSNTEFQPINLILNGDDLFVADRKKDSIYVLNKSTLNIDNRFPIMGMDSASAGGYIDLFVYSDRLYVVSDELDGITSMNLDGSGQEILMLSGYERLRAFGIFIKDGLIFLNGRTHIIIADLLGNVLDSWEIEKPDGYYDRYLEMEVVGDLLYIASSWDVLYPPSCDTPERPCGTTGSHILFYDVPLNYAPVISEMENETTFEDSGGKTIILTAYDFDGDVLSYSAVSDTDAVSIEIVEDTLILTSTLNWNGDAEISVFVSDGLLSDTTEFTLNVFPVNDLPEAFALLLPEDGTVLASPDETAQTFTWEPAHDVDGDEITYELLFTGDGWDLSIEDIDQESHRLSILGFPRGVDVSWTVQASDGETSVMALDTNLIQILAVVGVEEALNLPVTFMLKQNYPNPFNPTTTIRYGLPEDTDVLLHIYDIAGREVKTLVSTSQAAGWYTVQWNGTSYDGTTVGTGMYFARIQAGDFSQVMKMVYLR